MLEKSKPTLRNFMGEGVYDGFSIAKATSEHANILQHNLRDSDVRECIIHGASPFRALMSGVREKGENYTCIIDGQPICCLLYTSPSPRDRTRSRMPSSA